MLPKILTTNNHFRRIFWSGIASLLLLCKQNGGAIQAAEIMNSKPAAIPIKILQGRIMVPAKANGTNALFFLLDTGFGINTIHPDLVEPLALQRSGQVTIRGIAGDEKAPTYNGLVLDFEGATYAPRRVASLPSDAQGRRRRDGILGAGFFRRFVVEIDSRNRLLLLHEPDSFRYDGPGEVVPLEFPNDTPVIEATLLSPTGMVVRGRFEIDTGCDDALCLGRGFVETNRLDGDGETTSGVKRGVGGGARIKQGSVSELRLGLHRIEKPPANFFTEGSPAGEGLAGHIGMEALKRYKIIFDYARKRMILESTP